MIIYKYGYLKLTFEGELLRKFCISNNSVPLSKHTPPWLQKPVS
jgi:hypothetical protein